MQAPRQQVAPEGDPSPGQRRYFKVSETTFNTFRGETIVVPLFLNPWLHPADTSSMVPIVVFYQKLIGEGLEDWTKFKEDVQAFCPREASAAELRWLTSHHYVATTTNHICMAPGPKLLDYLKATLYKELLEPVILGLEEVAQASQLAHQAGGTLFPDHIPPCPLSEDKVREQYSLGDQPRGSKWRKQMDALYKIKVLGVGGLGHQGKTSVISGASWTILERSLEEYVGFAHKHLGLAPSLDLVMQPSIYSQFVAFQRARGLDPSTQLRAAQQVSTVVTFVGAGKCPQALAWGPSHASLTKGWFTSLKAELRALEAAKPAQASSLSSLADLWQLAEGLWETFVHDLQARSSLIPCMLSFVRSQPAHLSLHDALFHSLLCRGQVTD